MVKDKVINMDNGKSYYILEEIDYNEKKYILSLECDLDKDEVNENDYFVMELRMNNDELVIKRVEDDNVAAIVTGMLLEKVSND